MFLFFTVVQAIVAFALVGVILVQKSEGGGLGVGGNPAGLMSARGASDFLTKATALLAVLFVGLSITLAVLAASKGGPVAIDQTLERDTGAAVAPASGTDTVPLEGTPATDGAAAPATPASTDAVPLDQ